MRQDYLPEYPDSPQLVEGLDKKGRIIRSEACRNRNLGEIHERLDFSYTENSSQVEVQLTLFWAADSRYPDKTTKNTISIVYEMDDSSHTVNPGGYSNGLDGITSIGLAEADSNGELRYLSYYDANGVLTSRTDLSASATE